MNLYIYFRTRREDQPEIERGLQSLMHQLRLEFGHRSELLLKSEPQQSYLTWMEVYSGVPAEAAETLLAELDARFRQNGLIRLVQGERHVERFEPRPESGDAAIRADRS